MKYMVMECHHAYAVLMAEDGRFLKAANVQYEVGQTVEEIIPLRLPQKRTGMLRALTAVAACLCLALGCLAGYVFLPYGTLRMTINPDVQMTISRSDRVVGLDGLNADGTALITGYDYRGKSEDMVARELVDRAIEMGYLSEGGKVEISVDAPGEKWKRHIEADMSHLLDTEQDVLRIIIEIRTDEDRSGVPEDEQEVVSAPGVDPGPSVIVPVVPVDDDWDDDDDDHWDDDDDDDDDRRDDDDDDDRWDDDDDDRWDDDDDDWDDD